MNVALPLWTAYAWWVTLLGAVALGIAHILKRNEPSLRLPILIVALWTTFALISYIRINLTVFQPQFRFLFAILPVLSAFVVGGLVAWFENRQTLASAAIVTCGLLGVAVNSWVFAALLGPTDP